jgi:murein tripeptide amidase MpaA
MRFLHVCTQFPRHRRLFSVLVQILIVWFMLEGSAWAQPASPQVVDLTLGVSTQGRPITAVRIGNGPRKLVLVGSTHGGPERNTFELATQLIGYVRANPITIPPDVRLYVIPTLNPDGLALGIRQNANGIDLNRNMDTRAYLQTLARPVQHSTVCIEEI